MYWPLLYGFTISPALLFQMPLLYSSGWPDLLILPSSSFPPLELVEHRCCSGTQYVHADPFTLKTWIRCVFYALTGPWFISFPLTLDSHLAFSAFPNVPDSFQPQAICTYHPLALEQRLSSCAHVQSLPSFMYFVQKTLS